MIGKTSDLEKGLGEEREGSIRVNSYNDISTKRKCFKISSYLKGAKLQCLHACNSMHKLITRQINCTAHVKGK